MWPRFWLLVAAVAVAFVAFGGDSIASSSRAVLHGLCAQRPSHSFTVDGQVLPFDARMTGIYTGALWTWAVVALRGRLLAAAAPPRAVVAVLASAVGALAVDGFNALAVDLNAWHPYEPMNEVRFFTGFGGGVVLVTLEVWLIGGALWKIAARRPAWDSLAQLWCVAPAALATLVVIAFNAAWIYPVLAGLLLASAWVTVSGLMLVMVALGLGLDRQVTSARRLDMPLAVSAIAGLAVIVALAQLRFWLERTLGIPQDWEAVAAVLPGAILEGLNSIARGLLAA